MKSIPGVYFINILHVAFLHKSVFRNFSLVTAWLFNFLAKKYHLESCSENVDEIDSSNPFFFFHTINAFQKGSTIIIDLVIYKDADVSDDIIGTFIRSFVTSLGAGRM